MNLTSLNSGALGKSGKAGVHNAHNFLFAIFLHHNYFLLYPL